MVADSASGHLPLAGGFGSFHARFGTALAVHVFSPVASLNAMAAANVSPRLHPIVGRVGSIAGDCHGGVRLGGGGSSFDCVGAAGRSRQG
jgi:hypothetical protein